MTGWIYVIIRVGFTICMVCFIMTATSYTIINLSIQKGGVGMRKLFLLLCTVAVVMLTSACGGKDEKTTDVEDAAGELGKEFVEKLYTVDDPSFYQEHVESTNDVTEIAQSINKVHDKFVPYLTEEAFDSMANPRFFLLPLEAASKQNMTISARDIKLVPYENEHSDSDSIDFEHSITLIFSDSEDNKTNEVELTGQMTVVDTDDGLKISRYHDSKIPEKMFNP